MMKQSTSAEFDQLPDYLHSYENVEQHFRAQLEGLPSSTMGTKFAEFVRKIIPQTDIGLDFEAPVLNQKQSNDEGIDLIARAKDGASILYVQAKLWVDRVETIDSVMSKFQAFYREHHTKTSGKQGSFDFEDQPVHFVLVTLSRIDGLLKRYESKELGSKAFYNQCRADSKIHFVHGHEILSILQAAYLKTSQTPTNLVINLETEVISKGNIFFGVIASSEIQTLYRQFGDALFFENIRDFIGLGKERAGRTTPNQEIIKTIQSSPSKMLERNNGIVIRADRVQPGDSLNQLLLSKGSIVNGCQTTMCLVHYATEPCFVPVKIVQTNDSWDVAKAANYQNSVESIDLDLAQHLRPQLAKRAGAIHGVRVDDGSESALQIVDEIYDRKVAYDETRLLYIGMFSRTPNNLFAGNYTELNDSLIRKFYEDDPYGEKTFETLFSLQNASLKGLQDAESKLSQAYGADKFKRFFRESSPAYRCFTSILALCGALNEDISDRGSDVDIEFKRMNNLFHDARVLLQNHTDLFARYFTFAAKVWMQEVMPTDGDDAALLRDMNTQSKRANFTKMLRKLSMDAALDEPLREMKQRWIDRSTA